MALDIINSTNLSFFHSSQKAEIFSMKAEVMARLGLIEDANRVFAQAVQIDLNFAKAWSLWGNFNDQRFRQTKELSFATNSVNCYLQAATLLENLKARKFLFRILWILTFETPHSEISSSFELYNADLPQWYWITFLPQFTQSLSRFEASIVHLLFSKLIRSFPQVAYFHLRTLIESKADSRPIPFFRLLSLKLVPFNTVFIYRRTIAIMTSSPLPPRTELMNFYPLPELHIRSSPYRWKIWPSIYPTDSPHT